MTRKIMPGDIINGHKILDNQGHQFLFECGRCGSFSIKNKSNLHKNNGCSYCAKANQQEKYSLRVKCWILGLYLPTVKSRIQRGWTLNEALYQDKRVFKESLNEKDLIYISKDREKNHEVLKESEKKSYLRYKLKMNDI